MTPLEGYQKKIEQNSIQPDSQQLAALHELQKIYMALIQKSKWPWQAKTRPKGLYLWGKVGGGKTLLMDLFFDALPFPFKRREHFHSFMIYVHRELKALQGKPNPLKSIAKKISSEVRVLCFDEFIVTDILDAMLLGGLLNELFCLKLCLVVTSNTAPERLYAHGLQRERFLPAIHLIQKHMQVLELTASLDYRYLHANESKGIIKYYFTPLDHLSEINMMHCFDHLTKHQATSIAPISLFNQSIAVRKRTSKVIWFDFNVICGIPCSREDYLEISKTYKTILLSNVPIFQPHQNNVVRSWINLIDVLYDAQVHVIVSAQAWPERLYTQGPLLEEYRRTRSRLYEMARRTRN